MKRPNRLCRIRLTYEIDQRSIETTSPQCQLSMLGETAEKFNIKHSRRSHRDDCNRLDQGASN